MFGDQLRWQTVVVVLSEDADQLDRRGLTPEIVANASENLAALHGMPIETSIRPRLSIAVNACRAVVAARLRRPDAEDAMLRRLRVAAMGGALIDEPDVIRGAAAEAGIDPDELTAWLHADDVEASMRADMVLARSPAAAALALDHKLADADAGRRYTCPSYEMGPVASDAMLVAPGFQPMDVYDALVANVAPDLARRPPPPTAREVLEWAQEPLATAEVAMVMGVDRDEARRRLMECAEPTAMGTDAFWSLSG